MEDQDHSPSVAKRSARGVKPQLKPSEVLTKAADLIEPAGAWTQGAYARTARNRPIGYSETPAVCWCAIGAILRTDESDEATRAQLRLYHLVGDIPDWNDAPDHTQAEVVAALRKAAELARSEGH